MTELTYLLTALRRSLSSGSWRHPSDDGSGERMSSWYLLRLSSLVQQSQTQAKKKSRKRPAWAAAYAKVLGWRMMVQKQRLLNLELKRRLKE